MSAPTWIRTVGAWAPITLPVGTDLPPGYLPSLVLDRLKVQLDRAGAVPVGSIGLQITHSHAFGPPDFPEDLAAVLAETRAIVLRHPNPFPELRLFRWLP